MELVAHRGNAREYPENTLPAFQSALDLGIRHLELDVQISSDGVPIVIHDPTFKRTADRKGSVHDFKAAQITAIEAAEPRRFGDRYRGTTIPLLTDVLALLGGRPDVTLFVEIKRESLMYFGLDKVTRPIVEAIAPWKAQCVVISFDLAAVVRARELGHDRIGWVLTDVDGTSREKSQALKLEYLFIDHRKFPRAFALWPGTWQWVAYEIDKIPLATALGARGVGLIETMAIREMMATPGLAAGPAAHR